mmetsp:Transcript_16239/g.48279  ORF Transcript_16239/g.48279 Transcript_16239/m.48279 type:complete len:240 (+) Transcript_16239:550-1269(+)
MGRKGDAELETLALSRHPLPRSARVAAERARDGLHRLRRGRRPEAQGHGRLEPGRVAGPLCLLRAEHAHDDAGVQTCPWRLVGVQHVVPRRPADDHRCIPVRRERPPAGAGLPEAGLRECQQLLCKDDGLGAHPREASLRLHRLQGRRGRRRGVGRPAGRDGRGVAGRPGRRRALRSDVDPQQPEPGLRPGLDGEGAGPAGEGRGDAVRPAAGRALRRGPGSAGEGAGRRRRSGRGRPR